MSRDLTTAHETRTAMESVGGAQRHRPGVSDNVRSRQMQVSNVGRLLLQASDWPTCPTRLSDKLRQGPQAAMKEKQA